MTGMNGPSRSSDPRKWQGVNPASKDAPRSRRGIYGVAAGVLLLAGTTVALLLWIRPVHEPYFVGICIEKYSDPRVPYRAWVAQDREALLALPPWRDQNHDTFNQQQLLLLQSTLGDLGKYRDRPLVVYLNAYAVRNERSEIHILPGDGRLDDPATWLPLGKVLDAIRDAQAPHKLLLLDIMQPLVLPELGLFDRVTPGELSGMLQNAVEADSKLLVLGASSEGRNSLSLEEEKRSVFAYYLERGVLGAADGWSDSGKHDGRVSSQELARFVVARVERWTQHNLGKMQTPFVMGTDDFIFPPIAAAGAGDETEPAEPEAYPEWLKDGWTRIDAWREVPTKRVPASVCADLLTTLLRVERDRRRGQDPTKLQKDLEGAISRFDGQAQKLDTSRVTPRSLEEAARLGRVPADIPKDIDAKLVALARLEKQARVAKPDPKLVEQWTAERDKFLEGYKDKPLDLAWLVWRAATADAKPGRDATRFWGGLLNAAWKDLPVMPTEAAYPESRFLLHLAKWSESYTGEAWPLEAVRDAIAGARAREQAAAEPNAPAWANALRETADKSRADAERLLLAGSLDEAAQRFHDALDGYNRLNQHLHTIRQARQSVDEATVLLLGSTSAADGDSAVLADWSAAVRMTPDVRHLIGEAERQESSNLPIVLRDLDTKARELSERLNKLGRPFQGDRLKRLLTPTRRGEAAELVEMEAAFAGPWLSYAQRVDLWKVRSDLAARLHRETLAEDTRDDRQKIVIPPAGTPPGESERRERRQEEVRHARVSIGKLSLLHNTQYPDLDALVGAAEKSADAAAWNALVRAVRQAWK
jgi:hypothetical protein